jgi:hypothetical protein
MLNKTQILQKIEDAQAFIADADTPQDLKEKMADKLVKLQAEFDQLESDHQLRTRISENTSVRSIEVTGNSGEFDIEIPLTFDIPDDTEIAQVMIDDFLEDEDNWVSDVDEAVRNKVKGSSFVYSTNGWDNASDDSIYLMGTFEFEKVSQKTSKKRTAKPKKALGTTRHNNGADITHPQDAHGNAVKVGDKVEVEIKGKRYKGTISAVQRKERGAHSVTIENYGKYAKRAVMVLPKYMWKATENMPTNILEYAEPVPAEMVKEAIAVSRKDCDEREEILITPTQLVVIDTPAIADPAKGDRILTHPDGTPIAVIKGSEVKKHYKQERKKQTTTDNDGAVSFDQDGLIPTAAEKERDEAADREVTPENKVARRRPSAQECDMLRDEAKPALKTFMEGMRQRYIDEQTNDKITAIFWRKSDQRIVLRIRQYGFLDFFSGDHYYTVCPDSAKLTKTTREQGQGLSTLFSMVYMRDFYRHPNEIKCAQISRSLYQTCYKQGACTGDEQKKLYAQFVSTCNQRQNDALRGAMKYVHAQTAKRWTGYTGEKSYGQLFSETLQRIKSGN